MNATLTDGEALPAFLRRRNGRLEIIENVSVTCLLREIKSLHPEQQNVFGEALLGLLGYRDDCYTGWTVWPPELVAQVLFAPYEALLKAWLIATGFGQLAEELP